MNTYDREEQLVATAHAQFPSEFGLRAFPGERFKLAPVTSSFVVKRVATTPPEVQLVVQVLRDGQWLDFGRNTPEFLKAEMVTIVSGEGPFEQGTVEVMVPFKFKVETLISLLVSAVEGGSNYWADFKRPRLGENPDGTNYDRIYLLEHEPSGDATPLRRDVTAVDLAEGIRRLAVAAQTLKDGKGNPFASAPKHLASILEDDADAETADVVLQLTVFNEIIYG